MNNHLIAIGCDSYDHLPPLEGACNDAQSIFEALVGTHYGSDCAALLLSPTRSDVQETIRLTARHAKKCDVLTLYFAGHGETSSNNFYMATRDTGSDDLPLSSLPLNDVFALVKLINPREFYILIDACNAGGGHFDLHNLLNDPRMGSSAFGSVSCFASSGTYEFAHEANGRGVATSCILPYLTGDTSVQTDREYLDLLEIGRAVHEDRGLKPYSQTPVSFGLNLYGPGRFAKNPHYDPSNRVLRPYSVTRSSDLGKALLQERPCIQQLHRAAGEDFDPTKFLDLFEHLLPKINATDEELNGFLLGLFTSLINASKSDKLTCNSIGVHDAFLTLLCSGVVVRAASFTESLFRSRSQHTERFLASIQKDLSAPEYLHSKTNWVSNFFFAPIRLSKLLGLIATQGLLASFQHRRPPENLSQLNEIAAALLHHHHSAALIVSEEQAAHLYLFFAFCRLFEQWELGELAFGLYFEDLVRTKGKILRQGSEPTTIYRFLKARGTDLDSTDQIGFANPNTVLPIFLQFANLRGLESTVDPHLRVLDHIHLSYFLPSAYYDFGKELIENGQNHSNQIGHDIWTVKDFNRCFEPVLNAHLTATASPPDQNIAALSVIASFSRPDRIPYCTEAYLARHQECSSLTAATFSNPA